MLYQKHYYLKNVSTVQP